MKKLLGLVLVLSFASIASASFLLSVDGVVDPQPITLAPSGNAIIDMHGFDNGNLPKDFWIIVQGPGITSGGVSLYGGTLDEVTTMTVAEWEFDFGDFGYAGATSATYINLATGSGTPPALIGKLVDQILFHCEGLGDVMITLTDGGFETVYDTQLIHQIPEPATMALLCLGGLLIRKK